MESYVVQLFSAAFDRVSHSGWSLIQIEVYLWSGSVLSICREFHSNRRQGVMVDGATQDV